MSDTMGAAALGLVIPVLATSVCRKLWKHGLSAARGRRSSQDGGLLTPTFVLKASALLAACYAFKHVASSMQSGAEHFDPYQILDLPLRANATVIKSHYRRLSLKHHPDKNPGNRRQANKKFNQVAKAYKALSDPEARRNWEQYGHPDGYQPWTFDLALPGWLRPGKDTGNGTLALYGVGYLAVLIGFVLSVKLTLDMMDPAGGHKQPAFEVTEEDVMALLRNLNDTSSTEDVLECLAACPQLCSEERHALAEEMEPISAPVREWLLSLEGGASPLRASGSPSQPPSVDIKVGRKGKGKGSKKAKGGGGGGGDDEVSSGAAASAPKPAAEVEADSSSRGTQGEGNRRNTRSSPELSQMVTHNLVVLLSALYRRKPSENAVDPADGVTPPRDGQEHGENDGGDESARLAAVAREELDREQEIVFGLAEPLLDACISMAAKRTSPQLFGTVVEAKAMLRRRLWSSQDPSAFERQEKEADMDLDAAVPSIKVESVVVETWGESQIALGDTVTATITIIREHAPAYRGFRRRRPENGFLEKGEPWWVILAGGRGGETLIGVTPMLVENLGNDVAECKIKFQAPRRPGIIPLVVFVKSPVFVGVDCEGSASFRVYRHDELKEDEDAGDW